MTAPPAMPPPPLPSEYANVGGASDWSENRSSADVSSWNNTPANVGFSAGAQKRPVSQQVCNMLI